MPASTSRRPVGQPMTGQTAEFRAHKQTTTSTKRSNLLGTRPQLTQQQRTQQPATAATSSTTPSPPAQPTPTSRLCLKNLPAHYTETHIATHFSTLPDTQLTDVRLMRTPDGRSRKFAFIGLRSAGEAERVRHWFDRNYIETCRIEVQFALERGSTQIERAWSKYSKDSSRHAQQHSDTAQPDEHKDNSATTAPSSHTATKHPKTDQLTSLITSILPTHTASTLTADPLFHDYMHAMGGRKKVKFWENDEGGGGGAGGAGGGVGGGGGDGVVDELKERVWRMMEGKSAGGAGGEEDSEDEYENAPVIGADAAQDEANEEAETDQADGERLAKASMSDADYFKARQSRAFDSDDEKATQPQQAAEAEEPEEDEEEEEEKEQQSAKPQTVELDDTRLFIRNLPFTITDDDLRTHFASYGPIDSIHIPTNADGTGKGFAFLTYHNASHAQHALTAMNRRIVMGRLIHILPAQARPAAATDAVDSAAAGGGEKGAKLTYKQQKVLAMKKGAGDATHSNTLFLRADTVMASMAERLQVDKADILNVDDKSSLAVRLALAESHLINETKAWLQQQGVNVPALERSGDADLDAAAKAAIRRSDRVVLCKNIPYETEASELRSMFGKFGALARVLLPPSKTLALVEYEQAAQAKKGYTALAYTKYQHVPLYLEWAPMDTFAASKPAATTPTAAAAAVTTSSAVVEASADTDSALAGNTMFVKNLSFATTEQSLLDLFRAAAAVRSVHIATKRSSAKAMAAGGAKVLSMGYGFVELRAGEDVQALIGRMQGVQLDGHALELKPSTRSLSPAAAATATGASAGGAAAAATDGAGVSRRLIVKNLPFEATVDEVRALFKAFAAVSRVRLPRKMDGSHRGYGFVDFSSGEEAREAMARLGRTHLYGRALVLQYSDERDETGEDGEAAEAGEERVRRQRDKVRRHYEQSSGEGPAHKRSRKAVVEEEDV